MGMNWMQMDCCFVNIDSTSATEITRMILSKCSSAKWHVELSQPTTSIKMLGGFKKAGWGW
jgi:hypothetical protein